MHLFAAIIAIVTGLITIINIFVGFSDTNDNMKLIVNVSEALFFASLLFFIISSMKANKN